MAMNDAALGAPVRGGRKQACNVVHVILPQGNGDRYARAARELAEWRQRGQLVADQDPGLYVVRQQFATPDGASHLRTGVIAAGVVAEPFANGRVKPHEKTHAGPKQDRLDLLRATATMCEALLMLSRDPTGALRQMLADVTAAPPLAHATLDDVEIALWRVDELRAAPLAAVAGRDPLYIADGHHRHETTVAYLAQHAQPIHTLALIVPLGDPGLVVLPTHRLVGGKRVAEAEVARMADHYTVEPLPAVGDARKALAELARGPGGCVVVLERQADRPTPPPGAAPGAIA